MVCKHRRYVAKVVNTFLLTMGGYSFGVEVGHHVGGSDIAVGFLTAMLFCAFSFWMRKVCDCVPTRQG
jgi:hypothetical protein